MTARRSTVISISGPLLVACLAGLWLTSEINSPASLPLSRDAPGLTSDETFNVRQGIYLVVSLKHYGLGLLAPASIREVFEHPGFLPDHPPLGRFVLGSAHELSRIQHAAAADSVHLEWARRGSAVLFLILLVSVGLTVTRWQGVCSGTLAAAVVLLMPRTFGHAHLAALETCTSLTFCVALLHVAHHWSQRPPAFGTAIVGGILLGFALLSKVQAILLPLPVTIWAVWLWRWKSLRPLALWGLAGGLTFFVGWPWLWLDPWHHTLEYLGRTTGRIPVNVWYLQRQLPDVEVPWHYPFTMFAATLPLTFLLAGTWGTVGIFRRSVTSSAPEPIAKRRQILIGLTIVFVLGVFAFPGTPVYDGERLFAIVFPLWAVLVVCGWQRIDQRLLGLTSRPLRTTSRGALVVLLLGLPAWRQLAVAPAYLSFYGLQIGGLRGGERLGFELSYWGDGMSREFLDDAMASVPDNTFVDLVPVAHPAFLQELEQQHPAWRARGIRLRALDHRHWEHVQYVLSFRRMADLPGFLRQDRLQPPVALLERDGVRLAALHRIDPQRLTPDGNPRNAAP